MVKFHFVSTNIAAYGAYILYTLRYTRACNKSNDFADRVQLLTQKLLTQCYDAPRLKSVIQKLYCRLLEHLTGVKQNHVFHIYVGLYISAIIHHTFIRLDYMSIDRGFLQENGIIYIYLGTLLYNSTYSFMLFFIINIIFLLSFYYLFFLVSYAFSIA